MGSRSVAKRDVTAYRCQIPEQMAAVEIDLDVIDQLGAAVMTGYSLVPKRGAEIGGLLLGKVESEEQPVVRVLDFVAIPIEYLKGPSYRLSDQDRIQFASKVQELRREPVDDLEIVGLYRSHTRENFGITEEDVALFDEHCASLHSVFLLIRPSAIRMPEAGLLARQHGQLTGRVPAHVFPFRRKALEAGGSPARHAEELPYSQPPFARTTPITTNGMVRFPQPDSELLDAHVEESGVELPFGTITAHEPVSPPPTQRALTSTEPKILLRNPWIHPRPPHEVVPLAGLSGEFTKETELEYMQEVGVPLMERGDAWQQARASSLAALDYSLLARERRQRWLAGSIIAILFLIVGVIGGMEVTGHAAGPARVAKPIYYEFGLQADRRPQGVSVTWDGRAPAMREAVSGLLIIQDGADETRVPLSATELERGKVLYRNRTREMRFRLEVPQGRHSTLIESVELNLDTSAPQ